MDESTHIRTIIVGAGPAGTACGYTLVKKGHECLLIDRKTFPRDKLCGGGLTPKAHLLIDRLFQGIQYDYFSVKDIEMYSDGNYICNFTLDKELRTVSRKDFDNILLKEYEKVGGRFINDRVVGIEEKDSLIYIKLVSGKILCCDYLIGADGANSIVRKYIQPNFPKGIVCLEKYVSDTTVRNMRVYFDRKFKNGYLYLFPNQKGYVVGYGDKRTSVDIFHDSLKSVGLMDDAKTKGAYIPMYDKLDYPYLKHIMLIGDAGGYADSMTGEGIYFAVKSGENAALAIINNADFRQLNKPIIDPIKRRKWMADIFFFPLINKLFVYMCTKKSLFSRINNRINKALNN